MEELRPEHIRKQEAIDAEFALLRHLALEGELAMRRDQLQAEHQACGQRLLQARSRRQALIEAVQAAGGDLPRWDLGEPT